MKMVTSAPAVLVRNVQVHTKVTQNNAKCIPSAALFLKNTSGGWLVVIFLACLWVSPLLCNTVRGLIKAEAEPTSIPDPPASDAARSTVPVSEQISSTVDAPSVSPTGTIETPPAYTEAVGAVSTETPTTSPGTQTTPSETKPTSNSSVPFSSRYTHGKKPKLSSAATFVLITGCVFTLAFIHLLMALCIVSTTDCIHSSDVQSVWILAVIAWIIASISMEYASLAIMGWVNALVNLWGRPKDGRELHYDETLIVMLPIYIGVIIVSPLIGLGAVSTMGIQALQGRFCPDVDGDDDAEVVLEEGRGGIQMEGSTSEGGEIMEDVVEEEDDSEDENARLLDSTVSGRKQ
jgi:hypothetical protein